MKIPIHTHLEKLGLGDLEIDSPEELENVKKELDNLIIKLEKAEGEKNITIAGHPKQKN